MIYYATDTNTRTITYGLFMFFAVAIQSLLNTVFNFLGEKIPFIDISSISAFAIFSLMFIVYDRFLWNLKLWNIRLSNIPDFSGEWIGYIEERQEFVRQGGMYLTKTQELIAIHIYVRQTYRKISVRLRSMNSHHSTKARESECTTAGILTQDFKRPKLTYTWIRSDLAGSGEFLRKIERNAQYLEGHYQSNHPRSGIIKARRKETGENWYCGEVAIIQNDEGSKYVGVHIPEKFVLGGVTAMKSVMSPDEFAKYRHNQNIRDDGGFHMTVLDTKECARNADELKSVINDTWLWLRLVGIGRHQSSTDEVYFCVVDCEAAQTIRHKCGLGNKDMHVTLGFSRADLHDVPKGESTLIKHL